MDQQNLPQNVGDNALPSSTLATVSLISAILGFTFVPVVGGIVALVTGYMARNETRSTPPRASGDGMATAGIVMGWIQMGLLVVGICCFIAYMIFVVGLVATSNQ
ncbi:MAG: DUF4190 domain-containing protein [Chloroflexi bacterium]|nr:MAG: DUF4190 domain-containing protein [Chloroflexota bacterium]